MEIQKCYRTHMARITCEDYYGMSSDIYHESQEVRL
jgi:hypothetical protein